MRRKTMRNTVIQFEKDNKSRLLVAIFGCFVVGVLWLGMVMVSTRVDKHCHSRHLEEVSTVLATPQRQERPWIIATEKEAANKSSGIEEECLDLSNHVSEVTRISMVEFMHNGPGRPFLPLFQHIKTHYDKTNPSVANPFETFPSIVLDAVTFYNFSTAPASECRIHAIHNFKVAGTTLKSVFKVIPTSLKNYTRSVKAVYLSQQQQQQQLHLVRNDRVISFVRDPVARFVSAVRQVLMLKRCFDCNLCLRWTMQQQHQKNQTTTAATATTPLAAYMTCLLDLMEKRTSYLDRHLTPQAYTLYHATHGYDIHMDLMPMDQVDNVLTALGRPKHLAARRANVMKKHPSLLSPADAAASIGGGSNFSGTVSDLLDPALIRRICQVYAVDVVLMQEIRLTSSPYSPSREDQEMWCHQSLERHHVTPLPWLTDKLDFSRWWESIYSDE